MNNEENKGTMNHKNFDTNFFKEGLIYRLKVDKEYYVYLAVLDSFSEEILHFTVLTSFIPGVSKFAEPLIIKITPLGCIDITDTIQIPLDIFEAVQDQDPSNYKWSCKTATSGLYYYKMAERMRKNLINQKLQKSFQKNIEKRKSKWEITKEY